MAKKAVDVWTSFVAATPAVAARLRREPEGLRALLEGTRDECELGAWAHAVQYLMAGKPKGVRGPLAWFTTGGERLGRSARWLSPAQVGELSATLAGVEPDDLGDDVYDPARLDAEQVAPGGWVRAAEETDRLSTIRELYAYLREHLARQQKARKGVLVVTRKVERDEEPEAEPAPSAPAPVPARAPAAPAGELVLAGAGDRRYVRGVARPGPTLDPALLRAGLAPLGDLVVLPSLADGVVRFYRSHDGTIVAGVILDGERVGSTSFLSLLERDAVVVTSDAFLVEKPKRRYFGRTVSGGSPGDLVAALRERRDALAEKHGAAVVLPAELVTGARAWEAWWSRVR